MALGDHVGDDLALAADLLADRVRVLVVAEADHQSDLVAVDRPVFGVGDLDRVADDVGPLVEAAVDRALQLARPAACCRP